MSAYTIAIVTVLYLVTALDMLLIRRDYASATIWFGYTLANFGFLALYK
jgi:hypothetical protein